MQNIKNITLANVNADQVRNLLPDNLILLGYRGSIAHGTYLPSTDPNSVDDKDIMGVYVAPVEHYFGLGRKEVVEKFVGEWDAVSYELRKFINLLLKGNPNVISLLWLEEKYYIYKDEFGELLIKNRDLFSSKAIFHSFRGYAAEQMKKMTAFAYDGYMGAKRKALVDKYGYDCKNAVHLIRLLEMGVEFLTEGVLYVQRPNSQKLMAIKQGQWTLDDVKKDAERLFALLDEAYVRSKLPDKPDQQKAEQLEVDILRRHFA